MSSDKSETPSVKAKAQEKKKFSFTAWVSDLASEFFKTVMSVVGVVAAIIIILVAAWIWVSDQNCKVRDQVTVTQLGEILIARNCPAATEPVPVPSIAKPAGLVF